MVIFSSTKTITVRKDLDCMFLFSLLYFLNYNQNHNSIIYDIIRFQKWKFQGDPHPDA